MFCDRIRCVYYARISGSATGFLLLLLICGKAAAKVENFQLALHWPVISLCKHAVRLEQKVLLMEMGFTLLLSNVSWKLSLLDSTQRQSLYSKTAIHRDDEGWNTYSINHTKCFSLSTHVDPKLSQDLQAITLQKWKAIEDIVWSFHAHLWATISSAWGFKLETNDRSWSAAFEGSVEKS